MTEELAEVSFPTSASSASQEALDGRAHVVADPSCERMQLRVS